MPPTSILSATLYPVSRSISQATLQADSAHACIKILWRRKAMPDHVARTHLQMYAAAATRTTSDRLSHTTSGLVGSPISSRFVGKSMSVMKGVRNPAQWGPQHAGLQVHAGHSSALARPCAAVPYAWAHMPHTVSYWTINIRVLMIDSSSWLWRCAPDSDVQIK